MYNRAMRTTIEIRPEHRSALVALAARRGEKGFSTVIAEAVEEYLRGESTREQRRQELGTLAGSLSSKEADELRNTAGALREVWR